MQIPNILIHQSDFNRKIHTSRSFEMMIAESSISMKRLLQILINTKYHVVWLRHLIRDAASVRSANYQPALREAK